MDALQRFEQKVCPEPNSGCWLWMGAVSSSGYGNLKFGASYANAHRVAYELYVGHIPDGMQICHKCDVKLCVNPDHLFVGTRQDNMNDMVQKRRWQRENHPKAEKNGNAKLTISIANEIRDDPREYRKIAKSYGIGTSTVCRIKRGVSWV